MSFSQGGSASGSSSASRQISQTLSPITALLNEAFGTDVVTSKRGGFILDRNQEFEAPEAFQNILGVVDTPITEAFVDIDRLPGLFSSALDTGQEAVETGLIGPARELAQDIFQNDIIPDIQARLGLFGLTGNDSDVQAALLREGRRISTSLADTAADRRVAASAALPEILSGIQGIESGLRATQVSRTPEGRALELALLLGGISTQGQTGGASRSKSFSKANEASAGL